MESPPAAELSRVAAVMAGMDPHIGGRLGRTTVWPAYLINLARNTIRLANSAARGTYHAIRPKYAQRYLSEFEYRFNRRFDLPDIIPRLVYVALRTPPMPERLLKLRLA